MLMFIVNYFCSDTINYKVVYLLQILVIRLYKAKMMTFIQKESFEMHFK